MIALDPRDFRLLNDFQRDFPLCAEPWAELGTRLGWSADEVLARLAALRDGQRISRVGGVFAPRRIGASTLAAMAVPAEDLARVAGEVSRCAGVNHNYAREHRYNLWFVAGAADEAALARLLDQLGRRCGYPPLALPLVEEYHIDLGFDLASGARCRSRPGNAHPRRALSPAEWRLVDALQPGLPWTRRPFRSVGAAAGLSEEQVLATLTNWLAEGILRRFGVVVRHRELGWRANAMAVWAVPEDVVDRLGHALAAQDGVSLCYRRRPAGPDWPYTLFCMLHGESRADVEARRRDLAERTGLHAFPAATLFSTECFKQCGAHYRPPTLAAPDPVEEESAPCTLP